MRPHCREKRSLKSIFFTTFFVLSAPFCVVAQTSADLIISGCSKSATTVAPGAKINLSNTAKNQGSVAAGSFVIAFHLSADSIFGGSNDISFSTTRTISSLAAGATNGKSTSLTIPSTGAPGAYFICAQADSSNSVAESNETNNSLCTTSTLQIAAADLLMTLVSSTTSSVGAGGSLVVANTVMNQSTALTGSFKIAFRLSLNRIYGDGDDVSISSSRSPSSLAGGALSSADTTLAIPGSTPTGNYYVCSKADANSVVLESNETNNTLCSSSTVAVAGPVITGISPTSGSIGSSITISGSGFGATQGNSAVTFNGVSAAPTSWNTTAIVVPVPSGATTGLVIVKVSDVSSNGITFTVSPESSTIAYVYDELGRLVAETDSSMGTAVFNYDAVGNLLSIARQSSTTVSVLEFSPNSGPVGSTVTIMGTGFSTIAAQNTVKFNGVAAAVQLATSTQVVVKVPANATTGSIAVSTPAGSATSASPFTVSATSGPTTIAGFTPQLGSPGSSITITGSGFETIPINNRVKINVGSLSVSSSSTTTINSVVSSLATSGHISVRTPSGEATTAADFFVMPPPYIPTDVQFMGRFVPGESKTLSLSATRKIGLLLFDGVGGQQINLNFSSVSGGAFVLLQNPDASNLLPLTYIGTGGAAIGPLTLPLTGTYTNRLLGPDVITTIAGGSANGPIGSACENIIATECQLWNPTKVLAGTQGNVFFGESGSYRIRKIDANGVVSTFAGTGVSGSSGNGGLAINAKINTPMGMAMDTQGNFYFADYGVHRIRKISTTGIITNVAGTGVFGFSGDGGPATNAMLSGPEDVAVDQFGNLYIADTGNNRIRRVDTNGIISTVAGTGGCCFSGDGIPATQATLWGPKAVELDNTENLFIADSANYRVRKVNSSGIISTVAGNGILAYSGDGGPATNAAIGRPGDLGFDSSGNLFILDSYGYRVRKVDSSGIITTLAGNPVGLLVDGVPPSSAQFYLPLGMDVNSQNSVLIVTYDPVGINPRVRKIRQFVASNLTITLTSP